MGNSNSHDNNSNGSNRNDNEAVLDDTDPFDGIDTIGYRVLGVQPNSPASKAGLVSFLDFLIGAENQMLLGSGEHLQPGEEYDDVDLPALLQSYQGRSMEFCTFNGVDCLSLSLSLSLSLIGNHFFFRHGIFFLISFMCLFFLPSSLPNKSTKNKNYKKTPVVWNIKSQQARLVPLIPDDTWGGAGLLGVTIRIDNYAGAEDRLIRILSVEPQSPAAIAGLVPEKDFLLGTTHQTLDNTTQLATLLQTHQDQVIELYVYNTDSDMVRVVALMPTRSWGGQGLLGAEVGTGYLHRLPSSVRTTEGKSVERKVRYATVPGPRTISTTNLIAEEGMGGTQLVSSASADTTTAIAGGGVASTPNQRNDNNNNNNIGSGTAKISTPLLLYEVEPHLEMEPDPGHDDNDDSAGVEEIYPVRSTTGSTIPATNETKTHSNGQPAETTERRYDDTSTPVQPQERIVSSSVTDATHSSSDSTTPSTFKGKDDGIIHKERGDTITTTTDNKKSATHNDGNSQISSSILGTSSYFFPPPPKMHYDRDE